MIDETTNPTATPEDVSLSKGKKIINAAMKAATTVVVLVLELALAGVVGAYAGSYLSAKTIVADCSSVKMAKIGDVYVTCTVIAPQKDVAPR